MRYGRVQRLLQHRFELAGDVNKLSERCAEFLEHSDLLVLGPALHQHAVSGQRIEDFATVLQEDVFNVLVRRGFNFRNQAIEWAQKDRQWNSLVRIGFHRSQHLADESISVEKSSVTRMGLKIGVMFALHFGDDLFVFKAAHEVDLIISIVHRVGHLVEKIFHLFLQVLLVVIGTHRTGEQAERFDAVLNGHHDVSGLPRHLERGLFA